ncbi:MAG TPA: polysaccharide deacetylase family protein [Gaiellaceae bacterium]|nr:polysaccharide deacetylase family protein [Gaiellaceae bacterium]
MLDTLGGQDLGLGDDVPYVEAAWEQAERGERPNGDDLAEAFFHLARIEERDGPRDQHGRFPAAATCLDPLDPPLERLRRKLGLEPPRWGGARFAVCLSHDVDIPWRWTRKGVRVGAGRLKAARDARTAWREVRGLAGIPLHKLRNTDPNFSFERIVDLERRRGASSVFFLMAAHRVVQDGPAPETYDRLRPRVVEALLGLGAEIGLHASYEAATDPKLVAEEKAELERLGATLHGQRYHYLRVDPHRNLAPLAELGFAYDSSLGFGGAPGFRPGIAHPFRPWDLEHDRPLDLVEIPLAAMDVTLAEQRYLGLSVKEAERRLLALLDWVAEHGGGFSILWHTDRFDPATAGGWDRLYARLIDAIHERGGVCMPAHELAAEARNRL